MLGQLTLQKTLGSLKHPVCCLAIHPEDNILLIRGRRMTFLLQHLTLSDAVGFDHVVSVWNMKTGKQIQEITHIHKGLIVSITWDFVGKSGRCNTFVSSTVDGSICVYQCEDPYVRISKFILKFNGLLCLSENSVTLWIHLQSWWSWWVSWRYCLLLEI